MWKYSDTCLLNPFDIFAGMGIALVQSDTCSFRLMKSVHLCRWIWHSCSGFFLYTWFHRCRLAITWVSWTACLSRSWHLFWDHCFPSRILQVPRKSHVGRHGVFQGCAGAKPAALQLSWKQRFGSSARAFVSPGFKTCFFSNISLKFRKSHLPLPLLAIARHCSHIGSTKHQNTSNHVFPGRVTVDCTVQLRTML